MTDLSHRSAMVERAPGSDSVPFPLGGRTLCSSGLLTVRQRDPWMRSRRPRRRNSRDLRSRSSVWQGVAASVHQVKLKADQVPCLYLRCVGIAICLQVGAKPKVGGRFICVLMVNLLQYSRQTCPAFIPLHRRLYPPMRRKKRHLLQSTSPMSDANQLQNAWMIAKRCQCTPD
jgi:hypothetical protein